MNSTALHPAEPIPLPDPEQLRERIRALGREATVLRRLLRIVVKLQSEANPRREVAHAAGR